jgi:hypothetical protein
MVNMAESTYTDRYDPPQIEERTDISGVLQVLNSNPPV